MFFPSETLGMLFVVEYDGDYPLLKQLKNKVKFTLKSISHLSVCISISLSFSLHLFYFQEPKIVQWRLTINYKVTVHDKWNAHPSHMPCVCAHQTECEVPNALNLLITAWSCEPCWCQTWDCIHWGEVWGMVLQCSRTRAGGGRQEWGRDDRGMRQRGREGRHREKLHTADWVAARARPHSHCLLPTSVSSGSAWGLRVVAAGTLG